MQDNLILSPISLDALIKQIRDVVREEVKAELQKEEEQLVAPSEACKMFVPAISERTLFDWASQGLIQKHRLGGRTYYKRSEIVASLKSLKKYKVGNIAT